MCDENTCLGKGGLLVTFHEQHRLSIPANKCPRYCFAGVRVQIALAQKWMTQKANLVGKPIMIAAHLLESMSKSHGLLLSR